MSGEPAPSRRLLALVAAAALAFGACGSSGTAAGTASAGGSPGPGSGSGSTPAAVSPGAQGAVPAPAAAASGGAPAAPPTGATGTSSPSSTAAPMVPLAVVTGFANYRVDAVTPASLATRAAAGTLLVPCGAEASLAALFAQARGSGTTAGQAPEASARGTSAPAPSAGAAASAPPGPPGGVAAPAPSATPTCVPADTIPGLLHASSTGLALLPPGLVTPAVRVVPVGSADLFGETPARAAPYPLAIPVPAGWPASWTTYDPANVRVILTTGVNCPDRGVSYQTNVLGRGWDWLLQAGTARYTGRHWDPAFGWWVVDAVRTGHAGAVWALIRNADIAVSDFECSMTRQFTQHDSGTVFSIDPKVAPLMARAGFDVATIAADHNTNPGLGAVVETVDLFRANGIHPVGGGATLAQALQPAVLDVDGIRFGFVGFDAIGGSAAATADSPGVAPLTTANARTAIAAARREGAQVVVALPQWSSVEYRAAFTGFQRSLITELEAAGADAIVGADFHWAGAISITPGGRAGYRFVSASQGNFWFGQDWSRQTQEGVMTMLTFVGTRLTQVRLIPTVVLDDAQPNLTDPATDGQFVLRQVLSVSRLLNP